MNLWQHPRRVWAVCTAIVLACAAAPAVFLAAVDSTMLGRREPVAEPYAAPVPQGEDYYILRQLSARQEQQNSMIPDPERPDGPDAELPPLKLYVRVQSSLENMTNGSEYRDTVDAALQNLADQGVLDPRWVDWATDWPPVDEAYYDGYDGGYYSLDVPYYATDSLGFVTLKRFALEQGSLYTAFSMTMDSRTGVITQLWISAPRTGDTPPPAPGEDALRAFAAQAGLENLGDWAVPENCPYPNALYSRNGEALIAALVSPYEYSGWSGTTTVTSPRWFLNLNLQTCAEEELPLRTP